MEVSIIGHVININTVFTIPTTDHSQVDGLLKKHTFANFFTQLELGMNNVVSCNLKQVVFEQGTVHSAMYSSIKKYGVGRKVFNYKPELYRNFLYVCAGFILLQYLFFRKQLEIILLHLMVLKMQNSSFEFFCRNVLLCTVGNIFLKNKECMEIKLHFVIKRC